MIHVATWGGQCFQHPVLSLHMWKANHRALCAFHVQGLVSSAFSCLCHKHLAMVTISKQYCLAFQQSKKVMIPPELVAQHEGKDYLKIRPSYYKIIQIVCGVAAPKKNASLTDSTQLASLKAKRQEALAKELEETQTEGDSMGLEQPKKKMRANVKDQVVHIDVEGHSVPIFCSGGSIQADLQPEMTPEALGPIFTVLQEGLQGEATTKEKKARCNQ